ncbi:hypothetical protein MVEN_02237000 [Mycena venus]|uniref:Uncharacterized protein n=1 Tax=Mycena venus TaxID=2733690 RepID=A0A8H6X856_9AGAR|nr:hypothetical protein MVEN_02237000 [Mycena venus]
MTSPLPQIIASFTLIHRLPNFHELAGSEIEWHWVIAVTTGRPQLDHGCFWFSSLAVKLQLGAPCYFLRRVFSCWFSVLGAVGLCDTISSAARYPGSSVRGFVGRYRRKKVKDKPTFAQAVLHPTLVEPSLLPKVVRQLDIPLTLLNRGTSTFTIVRRR